MSPRLIYRSSASRLGALVGRLALLLMLIGGLVATTASPTLGHARLITSDPVSGSALAIPPTEFTLTFNEAVDVESANLDLLDAEGNPVAIQKPTGVDTASETISSAIVDPDAMSPGVYTLVWRVLSTVDGHVTTGSVAFSVGTGEAPIGGSTSAGQRPPWWSVLSRWIELTGFVALAGIILAALCHRRDVLSLDEAGLRAGVMSNWRSAWMVGTGVALTGMALGLWSQARWLAGEDAGIVPGFGHLQDALTATRYGQGWILRIILVAVMLLMFERPWIAISRWTWRIASLLALVSLFLISRSGHAAAETRPLVAIAIDTIHFTGVAFWLGGLVLLVLSLGILVKAGTTESILVSERFVSRHSRLALLTVLIIAATGIVSAQFHVSGPIALRSEDYGLVLLGKQGLVVLVITAAALNLKILRPRLRYFLGEDDLGEASTQLRGIQGVGAAELGIALFVLAATAALTQIPPADGPMPVTVAARATTIDQRATADDLDLWLFAELRGDPDDRYVITVTDLQGEPAADIQRVIIESLLLATDSDEPSVKDRFDAEPLEPDSGAYAFSATRLGLEGNWNLNVIVRRAGLEDVATPFVVDTTGTAQPPPRLVEDSWRMPQITAKSYGFVLMAILMLGIGLIGIRRLTGLEPLSSGVLLTLSILIATGFLVSAVRQTIPTTAMTDVENPVVLDSVVMKSGEDLYFANCAVCHGPSGRGLDVVDPLHNHGNAADLTDQRSILLADGDLFYWISEGVMNSDMPAYDQALTEEERWALVHYLRVLQGEETAP